MTFTQQLYKHLSEALPDMTSRKFSRYCGMSEGYYGSICAQKLPISTNALIHLVQLLEQLIADETQDITHYAQAKLRRVQQCIADEIAQRTQCFDIDNLLVRKMIISAVATVAYQRDQQHHMPFIVFG